MATVDQLWQSVILEGDVEGLDISHIEEQKNQAQNLGSLFMIDKNTLIYIVVQDVTFLLLILIQVFILKLHQRSTFG